MTRLQIPASYAVRLSTLGCRGVNPEDAPRPCALADIDLPDEVWAVTCSTWFRIALLQTPMRWHASTTLNWLRIARILPPRSRYRGDKTWTDPYAMRFLGVKDFFHSRHPGRAVGQTLNRCLVQPAFEVDASFGMIRLQ